MVLLGLWPDSGHFLALLIAERPTSAAYLVYQNVDHCEEALLKDPEDAWQRDVQADLVLESNVAPTWDPVNT